MSWNNFKESEKDDGYRTVDDEDYSNDVEYEPNEIAAWGDNSSKTEAPSWNNLIDPSVKIKAGGVGSGDLHRRGGNFKPLSEATILAQRLSKPIPGKKTGPKPQGPSKTSGASRRRKQKSMLAKPAIRTAPKPPIPVKSYQPPERKPFPNAPPSTWGSKPLIETPFWEVKKEPAAPTQQNATQTNTSTLSRLPGLNHNPPASEFTFVNPNRSTNASKWSPANLTAPSKWLPEDTAFQPTKTTNTTTANTAAQSNWNTNGLVSKRSPTNGQPASFVQIPESRPVKISALTIPSPIPQKPYFNIDLEIGNGISATITFYNDSDPKQMAEEFGKKHNLIVSDLAKYNLASIFQKLLNGKREKEQRLLQQQQ